MIMVIAPSVASDCEKCLRPWWHCKLFCFFTCRVISSPSAPNASIFLTLAAHMSRFGSTLMWKLSLFAGTGETPPPLPPLPPPPPPRLSRGDCDNRPSPPDADRYWFPVDALPVALDGSTHGWAQTWLW